MDAQPQNHAYTILRIKRKRTEEPLDALVVESRFRRKKSRGGIDVFQFAQTVEHDVWEDGALRQNLQSQISRLVQDENESAKAQVLPGRETGLASGSARTDNGRRYAVKLTGDDARGSKTKRRPTSPPKVISAKDVARNDFTMYDAVLQHQGPSLPPIDPEMERFLPMLRDYLTLQESALSSSNSNPNSYTAIGDDYVWDVFYRRPYTLSDWNSFAANYGTVTGLPPSVEDEDVSDHSESEPEDEADEDSNAEEYYKNDYPDEEDSDSDDDFFHDAVEDGNDGDYDWR